MQLRLSVLVFAAALATAACGDDDPGEDGGSDVSDAGADAGDGSVKDSSVEEDGGGTSEPEPEADAGDETEDAGL